MTGNVSISAIVQIAILYFAIYAILKSAKGSRFGQALLGVGVLAALSALFTFVLHFDVLSKIVQWVLIYLALSTVVIFRPSARSAHSTAHAIPQQARPSRSMSSRRCSSWRTRRWAHS